MTDGDDRVRGWLGRERPHETLACVEKYKIKTFRILIIMITNTAFSSHSVADVVSSQETKRIFERGSEGESVAYPPVLIIKRLGRAGHMSTRCSRREDAGGCTGIPSGIGCLNPAGCCFVPSFCVRQETPQCRVKLYCAIARNQWKSP